MHETEGMKREQEDDNEMNSPTKRSRNDDDDSRTDLRLLIPSKNAGAVIGKGGSNITRLRTEFKASVTVPDCPGPERVLTISADLETALEILMDIIPKLDDNVSHGSREFECEIRILVHQSHAGCIIGRAGFKIKELREQTGATIKVYSQCCPQSTDRVVQLSGKPEVVVDGVRRVYALIEQSPIKGPRNPYDPHNYDSFYQEEYGGFIDPMARGGGGGGGRMDMGRMGPGSRGPHSMGSRGSFGGMNEFPRRMGRGESGFGGGVGGAGLGGGRGGIMGRGNRGFRNGSGGGYNDYYPRRGGGQRFGNEQGGGHFRRMGGGFNYEGGPGSNDFTNDSFPQANQPVDDANASTTQVTVPKDLAGSIIGKGGARIRKIRHDSGASIIIDEAVPGSAERVITISGSPQQIQMAQYLLQQSVRDHSGGGSM